MFKELPILDGMNKGGYWRSLEELANAPEFRQFADAEFPSKHDAWDSAVTRRDFLKIMGASIAMAAFAGCRKPIEKIYPHNENPEHRLPGVPLRYATALPWRGFAQGVLATSYEGRPIKIEGNPKHPDTLGATDVFMQAAVLSLYDPDRSQAIEHSGIIETWAAVGKMLATEMGLQAARRGAGLRLLTETVTSPSLAALIRKLLQKYPQAVWHQYEPVSRDAVRQGTLEAFGRVLEPRYRLAQADVIVSLDADFLSTGPGHVRLAREFAARRKPDAAGGMNRLYVMEPTPTITGLSADHRFALKSSEIEHAARAIAAGLGLVDAGTHAPSWTSAVVRDLRRAGRRGLVLAGDTQPAAVHVLAHAINAALGSIGGPVELSEPVEAEPVIQGESLRALAQAMEAGQVDLLLVLGANPVATAPSDLQFAERMAKVPTRVHLGLYADETAELCHWHIPEAHPLESWGDLRAADGTVSIQQPLIEPLYAGKTASELLSVIIDEAPRTAHDLVKDFWSARWGAGASTQWRVSVHDGVVAGSALSPVPVSLVSGWRRALDQATFEVPEMEVVFRPDPCLWDGRFANSGWLQELPKPVSKLTWDNAAYISPATAKALGVENERLLEIAVGGGSVQLPVWILPGQADAVVTLHLGFGRLRAGRVGNEHGVNVYPIRTSGAPWSAATTLKRRRGSRKLACTQHHSSMENRALIREATLEDFRRHPDFAQHMSHEPKPTDTLYPPAPKAEDYQWGMTIDLNACNGCNACVLGCQSENNIPVVGKEQVLKGREMHWIRVDRYFEGTPEDPKGAYQPVNCMHCENAPCEPVCPVGATVHSDEGLNEMVYNRCIGTRYCSNNCPYKVRRFNFLQFTDYASEHDKLRHNPDVTVRMRGVMEKCTYCIQRITRAKIDAEKLGRPVQDGEIETACQTACPAQAIVFGNLLDPKSRVSALKKDPRNYGILTDLGTRPRTTYLARLKNPNPELPA